MSVQSRSSLFTLASRTLSRRSLHTQKPQLFTGSANKQLKNGEALTPKETLEKARNDLLDKLGSNSAGKIVASSGTILSLLFCFLIDWSV